MSDLYLFLALLALGYFAGRATEHRHYKSIRSREKASLGLPTVTSEMLPEPDQITQAFLVTGSCVISVDYFKRMLASLRNITGGRVKAYETLLDRARREAILRMKYQARGSHIVVSTRVETASIFKSSRRNSIGSIEVLGLRNGHQTEPAAVKYTPKLLDSNVNISKDHPLKEFAVLAAGILGALALIYVLLGFALELAIVPYMPSTVERSLGNFFLSTLTLTESPDKARLQGILDRLTANLPPQELTLQLHVKDAEIVNAMALPGGHIVLFQGLLDQVESENELAAILGHELGHFANRDHLRGLGRGLVFLVLSAVILGEQSGVTGFLQTSLTNVESRFSQRQERQADEFSLRLLQKTYGHVAGATDFFERLERKDNQGPWAYYFASHPSPADRVDRLKELIERAGYPSREKIPLALSQDQQPVGP